jgi:hypothetical protein
VPAPTNAAAGEAPLQSLDEVRWQALYWLLLLPLALMVAKWPALPSSAFLLRRESLLSLPPALLGAVDNVLFVPMGALVVVIFRLALGIRLLGPFRSILLALAFVVTGVWLGLLFTLTTVAVMVLVRPLIRAFGVPYFGRVSVMLSTVALVMVAGTFVGVAIGSAPLSQVARFPIVVLCLIGEAVSVTIQREGLRSGLWRTGTTTAVAVLVAALASIPRMRYLLLAFPELLLVEIALIVVVSRSCAWRLLERLNPTGAGSAGQPGPFPSPLSRGSLGWGDADYAMPRRRP